MVMLPQSSTHWGSVSCLSSNLLIEDEQRGRSLWRPSSSRQCSGVRHLSSNPKTPLNKIGLPNSFGIFQAHYSSLPKFNSDSHSIPVIGTLSQGLVYLGSPVAAALTKRFPQYQKQFIYFGWPLSILGLLTASFADSVPVLILTQGLMYGVGVCFFVFWIKARVN